MNTILSASGLLLAYCVGSVSAQNNNNNNNNNGYGYPYYYGGGLRSGAIVGIVIAAAAGILLLCIVGTMGMRRRRGAQTYLPGPGGGFVRINRTGSGNMNQAAYHGPRGYNGVVPQPGNYQSGPQPQLQQHQAVYKPPAGEPAPPPYPGKETYAGQSAGNAAPQPGRFAPPPGPPPPDAAHTNDGQGRHGQFSSNY